MARMADGAHEGYAAAETQLSIAELRVALLVRQGLATKEIARRLSVSPETIKVHRKHIRKKLGICGRDTCLSSRLDRIMQATHDHDLGIIDHQGSDRENDPCTLYGMDTSALLFHAMDIMFSSQDAEMRASGFPQADIHAEWHNQLLDRCLATIGRHRGGGVAPIDTINFMLNELVGHLLNTDPAFAEYLRAR